MDASDTIPYRIYLYNGANGQATNFVSTTVGNVKYLVFDTTGMQKESPDGIALVGSNLNTALELLSYEGVFTPPSGITGGPARNVQSTNVNVVEEDETPVGFSLQRIIGSILWAGPLQNTKGGPNLGTTKAPTKAPTKTPTNAPTSAPTSAPTNAPTSAPTSAPTNAPTGAPVKGGGDAPAAPISVPVPMTAPAPVLIPIPVPVTVPVRLEVPSTTITTKVPTKAPSYKPVLAPTNCGIFGWNFFCPRRGKCGFVRRLFNYHGC